MISGKLNKIMAHTVYKYNSMYQSWVPIADIEDINEAKTFARECSKYPTPGCKKDVGAAKVGTFQYEDGCECD